MSEQEQQPQSQFAIQRVYIKDLSFEAPNTPKVFLAPWDPEVAINLGTQAARMEDGKNYEVILSLTVTVKNDNVTAYLVEVQQAGIFLIDGVDEQQLGQLLGAYCPSVLFPYARGSFPQLLLAPVNFDAAFADAQRQRAQQLQAQAAAANTPETVQ